MQIDKFDYQWWIWQKNEWLIEDRIQKENFFLVLKGLDKINSEVSIQSKIEKDRIEAQIQQLSKVITEGASSEKMSDAQKK